MRMLDNAQTRITAFVIGAIAAVQRRADATDPDRDRGDVPGWVMITLMTAIVVIGLLAVFQRQVISAVQTAFNSITGTSG